jgi:hypothetical protein
VLVALAAFMVAALQVPIQYFQQSHQLAVVLAVLQILQAEYL